MILERVDDVLELARELFLALRRFVVAARHVLPDEDAETIAVVVPARRLDLHMLANQVEPKALRGFDVRAERGVRRRGVQTVRPPALIERTVLEQRPSVQEQPLDAARIRLHGDLAHAE